MPYTVNNLDASAMTLMSFGGVNQLYLAAHTMNAPLLFEVHKVSYLGAEYERSAGAAWPFANGADIDCDYYGANTSIYLRAHGGGGPTAIYPPAT